MFVIDTRHDYIQVGLAERLVGLRGIFSKSGFKGGYSLKLLVGLRGIFCEAFSRFEGVFFQPLFLFPFFWWADSSGAGGAPHLLGGDFYEFSWLSFYFRCFGRQILHFEPSLDAFTSRSDVIRPIKILSCADSSRAGGTPHLLGGGRRALARRARPDRRPVHGSR